MLPVTTTASVPACGRLQAVGTSTRWSTRGLYRPHLDKRKPKPVLFPLHVIFPSKVWLNIAKHRYTLLNVRVRVRVRVHVHVLNRFGHETINLDSRINPFVSVLVRYTPDNVILILQRGK